VGLKQTLISELRKGRVWTLLRGEWEVLSLMSIATSIKNIRDLIVDGSSVPTGWNGKAIVNDDNFCYLVWNEKTNEALLIDSCREDIEPTANLLRELKSLRLIAVIDTHTHADHISAGAEWSSRLGVPWVMHSNSPTRRAQLRVFSDTVWPTLAGPIHFLTTPGHTPDSLAISWGPFLFTADTIFYGDTGRDDLPGGDPVAHYESLQKIKALAKPEMLMLAGHDNKGGRISSWKTQLEVNAALTQPRDVFVPEAAAYIGPSPKLLKESLFENFK
jgi:glyoxylase-like metal-dependent hydrolase (beta-lactamase superfamily II)